MQYESGIFHLQFKSVTKVHIDAQINQHRIFRVAWRFNERVMFSLHIGVKNRRSKLVTTKKPKQHDSIYGTDL